MKIIESRNKREGWYMGEMRNCRKMRQVKKYHMRSNRVASLQHNAKAVEKLIRKEND